MIELNMLKLIFNGFLGLGYLPNNNNNSNIMYQLLCIYNLPGTMLNTIEKYF